MSALERLEGLLAHQAPQLLDLVHERLGAANVPITLGEPRIDDGFDAPWPRRHDRDPLGQKHRLFHVVGNEDHSLTRFFPDGEQFALHQAAGLSVERAERLVHQQRAGIESERTGDRGTLLHAAGKLGRVALLETRQSHQIDEGLRSRLPLFARHCLAFETIEHVLEHGLPGEQREVLEHDAAIGSGAGDRLALDQDFSGLGRKKPADEIEEGRLSATAWTEQRHEFALAHLERDGLKRQHGSTDRRPIVMAHRFDDDMGQAAHVVARVAARAPTVMPVKATA